jgi:hypothetical protein
VPNLATDAMARHHVRRRAWRDVEKLRREWLRHSVEESDEAAIEDALGVDEDTVAEGLWIFHGEEIATLCEQRGWAAAAFFKRDCSLMCFAELARTASRRASRLPVSSLTMEGVESCAPSSAVEHAPPTRLARRPARCSRPASAIAADTGSGVGRLSESDVRLSQVPSRRQRPW